MSRTIPDLWQKAVAANRAAPAYLAEEEDGWREVSWEEAARRVEEIAFGLLALGIEKGDVIGIMAATRLEWVLADFALARIGAVTAPIYPDELGRRCGLHARPGRGDWRLPRRGAPRPRPRAAPHALAGSARRARGTWPRVPRGASRRAHPGGGSDQRRRPLHLHLHVRDDRRAEGLHDPPPQLLRDGGDDRNARGVHARSGLVAPVPPPRAQLRSPPRPARRVRGLHDRVSRRPLRDCRRASEGAAHGSPERAAPVREGARDASRDSSTRPSDCAAA